MISLTRDFRRNVIPAEFIWPGGPSLNSSQECFCSKKHKEDFWLWWFCFCTFLIPVTETSWAKKTPGVLNIYHVAIRWCTSCLLLCVEISFCVRFRYWKCHVGPLKDKTANQSGWMYMWGGGAKVKYICVIKKNTKEHLKCCFIKEEDSVQQHHTDFPSGRFHFQLRSVNIWLWSGSESGSGSGAGSEARSRSGSRNLIKHFTRVQKETEPVSIPSTGTSDPDPENLLILTNSGSDRVKQFHYRDDQLSMIWRIFSCSTDAGEHNTSWRS